jgi:hypothetical protein
MSQTFFVWPHGGQIVSISSTFNHWNPQPLLKQGNYFFGVFFDLPDGVYQYKYVVDGRWVYDISQPHVDDGSGNWNNYVEVGKAAIHKEASGPAHSAPAKAQPPPKEQQQKGKKQQQQESKKEQQESKKDQPPQESKKGKGQQQQQQKQQQKKGQEKKKHLNLNPLPLPNPKRKPHPKNLSLKNPHLLRRPFRKKKKKPRCLLLP